MTIAIDMSPLLNGNHAQHRVRGSGFYLHYLKKSLVKYFPQHSFLFFQKEDKIPPNVSLVHFPYFEPFFLTLPLKKKHRSIVTIHDLIPLVFPKYFPAGIKGKIKWQIQKYLLKSVDSVITDSECSKSDIIKYTNISPAKIHVIYLAAGNHFRVIESKKDIEKIKAKHHLPEKFILYVGDATWNKNLLRLLEAVKKTNIPLVLVGKALITDVDKNNTWNQELVKTQEMAKQNKNIFRLGFVSDEDLVLLYNAATIFVMPSLYEGFGLPVLEAMSSGCPVVTSWEGSLKEVAGEAAYIINPYDTENIAEGIVKVYKDSSLQDALKIKGFKQVNKFSWEKTATKTMEVYEATN